MTKRDLILRRRLIAELADQRAQAQRGRARVLRCAAAVGLDVDKFPDRDARSIRWALANLEAQSSQYY